MKMENWNLVAWNVKSSHRGGGLINLIQEMKEFDVMIVAIKEVRW